MDAPPPTVHVARFEDLSARDLHDILQLRADVFVVEQECVFLEIDGRDPEPDAEHLWCRDDRGLTATARVLHEQGDVWSIGRVVTRRDVRSSGVAGYVMREAVARAERRGATSIVVKAQAHLAGWYGRLGFEVSGPEFLEDGIAHVPMRRGAGSVST